MHALSILVVENDQAGPGQIEKCLAHEPLTAKRMHSAATLDAAIGLLKHYSFDVMLVDPDLPDARGLETIRRILESGHDAAIIVIAECGSDEKLAIKSVRFGAQDYIEKEHLSPNALKKSIIHSIERKRILQEKEDLLADLTAMLQNVEALHRILPLCICCRKIFSQEDSRWLEIDTYLQRQTGRPQEKLLCPDCRGHRPGR